MAQEQPIPSDLFDDLALATSLSTHGDAFAAAEVVALVREVSAAVEQGGSPAERAALPELRRLAGDLAAATNDDRPSKLSALAVFVEKSRTGSVAVVVPQDAPPVSTGARRTSVVRDAETVDLIHDFLTESDNTLTKADELLMSAEHGDVSADNINALFRVFHTIKGVAGFLDFFDIVGLAHTTETLLDRIRRGAHPA